jgi:hypothetical protein
MRWAWGGSGGLRRRRVVLRCSFYVVRCEDAAWEGVGQNGAGGWGGVKGFGVLRLRDSLS